MTTHTEQFDRCEARRRQRVAMVGGIATSLVCAMLIWAKLRLVTDIPRTAYAAPEPAARAHEPRADTALEPVDRAPSDGLPDAAHAIAGE